MAGIVAMLAGGLNRPTTPDAATVRRQSSYKKMQEEATNKGGKIKKGRIQTIQLNRSMKEPCDVYSWFEVTITDIDVPSQTFDTSIEIHCFWQDFSLPNIFPEYKDGDDFKIDYDNLPIKMTEIFENQLSCRVVVDPIFHYYDNTSTIYMMFVCECKFVERMELQRFPLDRQFLSMEFNAYHGISKTGYWNWILTKNLEWVPEQFRNREYYVRMVSSISSEYDLLPPWINFTIGDNGKGPQPTPPTLDSPALDSHAPQKTPKMMENVASETSSPQTSPGTSPIVVKTNKNGAQKLEGKDLDEEDDGEPDPLIILLRVNRRPYYYYGNIVFPNFLIGLGCGAAFIVPSDELADRLGVLITLMLAAVAFRFVVSTMLPRVTYLTVMDKYLLLSFIFIIILIAENTIVAIENLFPQDWIAGFDYTFALAFYIGWGTIHLFFVLTIIWPSFYRISWNEMYVIDISDPDEDIKANDYRYVKTNDESKESKMRWKKYLSKQQENNKND